ncbi:MAG: hypothetical protein IT285_12645 [Bdellovibrionales bacterium]|nr:hypothetical protein [Bdellovibrionales bacterium]
MSKSRKVIDQRLRRSKIPPDRIFAYSDVPFNELTRGGDRLWIGHYVLRTAVGFFPALAAHVLKTALKPDVFGLHHFFPIGTRIQKVMIKETGQRHSAVEAMRVIFSRLEINPQLVSNFAQSLDELLMNAIFDAPVDKHGQPSARGRDRTLNWPLSSEEQVQIEYARAPDYIAIGVTDPFGSLDRQTVVDFIQRDYTTDRYKVVRSEKGAGLGVYSILESGQSILFCCEPKKRTQVVVFVPICKSMRKFRESFHFFGFFFR